MREGITYGHINFIYIYLYIFFTYVFFLVYLPLCLPTLGFYLSTYLFVYSRYLPHSQAQFVNYTHTLDPTAKKNLSLSFSLSYFHVIYPHPPSLLLSVVPDFFIHKSKNHRFTNTYISQCQSAKMNVEREGSLHTNSCEVKPDPATCIFLTVSLLISCSRSHESVGGSWEVMRRKQEGSRS